MAKNRTCAPNGVFIRGNRQLQRGKRQIQPSKTSVFYHAIPTMGNGGPPSAFNMIYYEIMKEKQEKL
jgi:hypothetical protein